MKLLINIVASPLIKTGSRGLISKKRRIALWTTVVQKTTDFVEFEQDENQKREREDRARRIDCRQASYLVQTQWRSSASERAPTQRRLSWLTGDREADTRRKTETDRQNCWQCSHAHGYTAHSLTAPPLSLSLTVCLCGIRLVLGRDAQRWRIKSEWVSLLLRPAETCHCQPTVD